MRPFEERVVDGRDEIVEIIATQLSAFRPCGATTLGPAEILERISALVDAFLEALRTRRVTPFVEHVRGTVGDDPGGERLLPAELQMVLDLLEELSLRSVADPRGRTTGKATVVVRSLIAAGREALPSD
ncbi:MAG: hypothetical protein JXB32_03065 [Deltaproteobacteria bacterium]|nr:hypothetical protein [Deltaproteobacteria bacterium]